MKRLLQVSLLCSALASPTSFAGVLFDNPPPASSIGGDSTFADPVFPVFGAENFQLGGAARIEQIAFSGYDHTPALNTDDPASIQWKILTDDRLQPLASGDSAYTKTKIGGVPLLFDFIIDIPDLELPAGAYWVAFHALGGATPDWAYTVTGDDIALLSSNDGASWLCCYPGIGAPTPDEVNGLAFRIEGTAAVAPAPEPAGILVLAGAVIALARRRPATGAEIRH